MYVDTQYSIIRRIEDQELSRESKLDSPYSILNSPYSILCNNYDLQSRSIELGHFIRFMPLVEYSPPPPSRPLTMLKSGIDSTDWFSTLFGGVGRGQKQVTKVVRDFLLQWRSNFHISHRNVNQGLMTTIVTCSQQESPSSSVIRAYHSCTEGHGFNSCWCLSLIFVSCS